jgi:hypothetical protein
MPSFQLERLTSYDDESLLNEIRRVAALVTNGQLTTTEFVRHSKVHWTTLRTRFGSWRRALEAAGCSNRFDDSSERWTREEIIEAIKSTARQLDRPYVTMREVQCHTGITSRPVLRTFGTFRNALTASGLSQSRGGRRYTDEECFENLLQLWTSLGRQPFYSDLKSQLSRVGPKAYISRWGSWRKAIAAFVERVNADTEPPVPVVPQVVTDLSNQRKQTSRAVPLGLRYAVLRRDRFRCILCGRSPATDIGVCLHVDHIHPWSLGGETVLENLRSLCEDCNLGKGSSVETPDGRL